MTDTRRHLDSVAGIHRVPTDLRRVDPALLPPPRPLAAPPKPARAVRLRRLALDALAWGAPAVVILVVVAAIFTVGYVLGHDAGAHDALAGVRQVQR